MARQQGALVEDRLWILAAIGFEFGEEANVTAEWEAHFDQLVDWLLWKVRPPRFRPNLGMCNLRCMRGLRNGRTSVRSTSSEIVRCCRVWEGKGFETHTCMLCR